MKETTTNVQEWLDHIMGGFTEEQLQLAFDCVKPEGNWKLRIEQRINASVVSISRFQIQKAIDFYAGGGATFEPHDDGSYTVRAPGYYALIGSSTNEVGTAQYHFEEMV